MEESVAWVSGVRPTFEFAGGVHLTATGAMPTIVHRSAASPSILAALADRGLQTPAEIDIYDDRESYIRRVEARAAAGAHEAAGGG